MAVNLKGQRSADFLTILLSRDNTFEKVNIKFSYWKYRVIDSIIKNTMMKKCCFPDFKRPAGLCSSVAKNLKAKTNFPDYLKNTNWIVNEGGLIAPGWRENLLYVSKN